MKLKCDNCGDIDHVLVDGYRFGERLMEGVMFKVEDKDGKPHAIGVTDDCKDYFEDFNKDKWLRDCEASCENDDVGTCPKCGDDVDIWGANQPCVQQGKWVPITKLNIRDIFTKQGMTE